MEPGFGVGFMWVAPKIRGTFLGVPIIRTIVFWGLYWGPLSLGNYHVEFRAWFKLLGFRVCFRCKGGCQGGSLWA